MLTSLWHVFLILLLIFGIVLLATLTIGVVVTQIENATKRDVTNQAMEAAKRFVKLPREEQERITNQMSKVNEELEKLNDQLGRKL